mmetsp:Transcript_14386/g.33237  ORF Transcript_14386/g.33237 Transcript_14386/m.33237 type:complete len:235 (+) Transcript_14386:1308-2012(+)
MKQATPTTDNCTTTVAKGAACPSATTPPPVNAPPLFSNAARLAVSRFRSRFVCSNVLLRISLSAVRFTLKLTSSSYFLLKDDTSANICSGLMCSMAARFVSRDRVGAAFGAGAVEEGDLSTTVWRTCSFLLKTGVPAVTAFHIVVSASARSFAVWEAVSPVWEAALLFSSAYFLAKSIDTAHDCTKNLSLEWSNAGCPNRSYDCINNCLSLSTNRIDTVSLLLGATSPWFGRTK